MASILNIDLDVYREYSSYALAEAELRSEGSAYQGLEFSQQELFDLFLPISSVASINLNAKGYNTKISDALLGYVEFEHCNLNVNVPYTLAASFPQQDKLSRIIEISRHVSVNEPLQILVSGSGALSGDLPAIGDLDYCEYFQRFEGEFFDRISSTLDQSYDKLDLYGYSISWTNYTDLSPFSSLSNIIQKGRESFGKTSDESMKPWMLEFVGLISDDEIKPITNLAIPVDLSNIEATAVGKSWAFQEALISETKDVPRELTSFSTFGAYQFWLRSECQNYLENGNDILKAAKRAYSLANSTFWYENAEIIRLSLSKGAILNSIERKSIEESEKMLADLNLTETELYQKLKEKHSRMSEINSEQLTFELDRCRLEIQNFLAAFDNLVSIAKGRY